MHLLSYVSRQCTVDKIIMVLGRVYYVAASRNIIHSTEYQHRVLDRFSGKFMLETFIKICRVN
jgi:hypothetical protein